MDISMALYTKKSPPNSDNDFSDESKGEALEIKRFIIRSDKNRLDLEVFH